MPVWTQIIRIPAGERVYIVNDTYDSIVTIMDQLKGGRVVQYRFEPFIPDASRPTSPSTMPSPRGEPPAGSQPYHQCH